MIIIDLNQVAISNLMVQLSKDGGSVPNESMLRHMILNTILRLKRKFGRKYGEVVIACDAKHSWRRTVFPYYKANRKKTRDASDLDWNAIFIMIYKIRDEIRENFPYRVIVVDEAEADDVIGTLVRFVDSEPRLIVSGDKDFIQLQKYGDVVQYDPTRDRYLTHDDPVAYLKEHIMRGDTGDGIPNYLSPDNCFVVGERQKAIRQVKLDVWLTQSPEEFCDEVTMRNYNRNTLLIDLSKTPSDIQGEVINQFETQANKPDNKLYKYFVKNRLSVLMESIGDFT